MTEDKGISQNRLHGCIHEEMHAHANLFWGPGKLVVVAPAWIWPTPPKCAKVKFNILDCDGHDMFDLRTFPKICYSRWRVPKYNINAMCCTEGTQLWGSQNQRFKFGLAEMRSGLNLRILENTKSLFNQTLQRLHALQWYERKRTHRLHRHPGSAFRAGNLTPHDGGHNLHGRDIFS